MSKIKILRILHRPSISGPTFHATYLTKGLSDKFETKLIVGVPEPEEVDGSYIFKEHNIDSKTIKNMKRSVNPFQDLLALIEIIKIIRKEKPQIVHTHAAKSGTLGRLAAYICHVPIIVHTFHGNVFSGYFSPLVTKIFLGIERFLANKSSKIITISKLQHDDICDQYKICDREKAAVIPLGLELGRFHPTNNKFHNFRNDWQIDNDTIAIGIIGRVTKIKNHTLFLTAFSKTKNEFNKKVVGIVVGDGDLLQEMKEVCDQLKLKWSDINSQGQLDYDIYFAHNQKDIPSIINSIDIAALSSDNEGTPVTLLEAQAAAKPIVSTRVGGVADVVDEQGSALLSEKGDTDAYAANLITMITKLEEYSSKTKQRSNYIIDKFSTRNLVLNIEKLYLDLLKSKNL